MKEEKFIINSAEYISSYVDYKVCPLGQNNEYAFIGRSNVGKSSLINMLAGRKQLAYISKTPGKTRTINLYLIDDTWNLVDLPGYGWAKAAKTSLESWNKLTVDYLLKRENLVNLFVLIDINITAQDIDLEFINYIGQKKIPFAIVFTKTDKCSLNNLNKNISHFKNVLYNYWEDLPLMFISSAINKAGREEILEYIYKLNKEIKIPSNKD